LKFFFDSYFIFWYIEQNLFIYKYLCSRLNNHHHDWSEGNPCQFQIAFFICVKKKLSSLSISCKYVVRVYSRPPLWEDIHGVQNGDVSKKHRTGMCFLGRSPGSRKIQSILKAKKWTIYLPKTWFVILDKL
jgi:hypothetical protein